jgi:hypothetical protein
MLMTDMSVFILAKIFNRMILPIPIAKTAKSSIQRDLSNGGVKRVQCTKRLLPGAITGLSK